jgi:hemerythrin-like domain-containing protein
MKVSDVLKEEHRQILRALDVLEGMATRISHGEALNKPDARDIVSLLNGFADRHHQGKEEAILFPALLHDRNQEHHGKLCCLAFEHDQERSLAGGLEEAVETNNIREFLFCAEQLIHKTRGHIETEERVLLPLADSVLSPIDADRVAADLRGFDRAWQVQVLGQLLKRLDEMETWYKTPEHIGNTARG